MFNMYVMYYVQYMCNVWYIIQGQEMRQKTVRLKLNAIKTEFRNKNVLLVDDSIGAYYEPTWEKWICDMYHDIKWVLIK